MKDSAKYIKIVEWSEEDQCYIGSAPHLINARQTRQHKNDCLVLLPFLQYFLIY